MSVETRFERRKREREFKKIAKMYGRLKGIDAKFGMDFPEFYAEKCRAGDIALRNTIINEIFNDAKTRSTRMAGKKIHAATGKVVDDTHREESR